jgi:hypothetical protein
LNCDNLYSFNTGSYNFTCGIYARLVHGIIDNISTLNTHTSILADFSQLFVKECHTNTSNSTKFKKIYSTININNSFISLDKCYINNDTKEFNEKTAINIFSNLTEIRKCF